MFTAGRDAGPDRQQAAVIVGAVAEIGEDMIGIGERRLADPRRALAAHLGEGRRSAVHPLRHEMAADAGNRAAALRHPGRAVVRAAGAEIGRPVEFDGFACQRLFLAVEKVEPAPDALVVVELQDPLAERPRDRGGRQFVRRWQQPLAVFVELADDARARRLVPVIQLLLQLILDQRPLSSTTTISSSPLANSRAPSFSSGQIMPTL